MIVQVSFGFVSAFVYLIAIFYASPDLASISSTTSVFPIAEIYHEATNSRGGAVGLLLLIYLATLGTIIGNSSLYFDLQRNSFLCFDARPFQWP